MTAGERLDLLERPSRLFTPKYRYFAASIGLCIFQIVNGSLAFSGFDWVLQAGIIATVAGLNAITIAMLLAPPFSGLRQIALLRLLTIATIVIAANVLFLFLPSDVMGTTGTVIVAITDPNFSFAWSVVLSDWYAASAKPAIDALLDGRAVLWEGSVLATLWACVRLQDNRPRSIVAAVAGLFAACLTIVVATGSPFATYLLLPDRLHDERNPIREFMMTYGPPIPTIFAGIIGSLLNAVKTRNMHVI